jgi:eukaryotic-like serine/threonine-protein kinase
VKLRPNAWQNHAALGLALYDAGQYAEAIGTFQRVTVLQPDNAWGFQMVGAAYHAQDVLPKALQNYEAANRITPTASAYSNIGTIHYWSGRLPEAVQAYEKAITLNATRPATHVNLGDTYLKLRKNREARAAYTRARELANAQLRVNPRDQRALALLALCEAKLGDRTNARLHINEAERINPDDKDTVYRKAAVLALINDHQAALEALSAAVARGYSRTLIRRDDDMAVLRNLQPFRALVDNGG